MKRIHDPACGANASEPCTCERPALPSRLPKSQLPEGCVHIGWQLATVEAPWLWRGIHPHFFDEWSDDVIAIHTTCRPVFLALGGDSTVTERTEP